MGHRLEICYIACGTIKEGTSLAASCTGHTDALFPKEALLIQRSLATIVRNHGIHELGCVKPEEDRCQCVLLRPAWDLIVLQHRIMAALEV
jgi:hypothetical protein